MEAKTNRNKLSHDNQKVDQGPIQGTSAVHPSPASNKTKTSAFPATFFSATIILQDISMKIQKGVNGAHQKSCGFLHKPPMR